MKSGLLITILAVTLLVGYCYLGMSYLKQGNEQEALTSQISEVSQTLREIPEPAEDLEQRLAAAQGSLAAAQGSFPSQINTTQVINSILELADSQGVKAIPMETQPWLIETVGEHEYCVFRLNVAAEGSLSQLQTFIGELEQSEFKTLIMEGIEVSRNTKLIEEGEGGTVPFTASLNLAIYTQSPSSN